MRRPERLHWQFAYAGGCLVYVAWVVHLSFNNFAMVHSDYRQAGERLRPARIEAVVLQELDRECRKELQHRAGSRQTVGASPGGGEEACLSWPETVVVARRQVVAERLAENRSRAGLKLVVFYVTFGGLFLVLPPVVIYLLLSFFIWLYRNIKVAQ